jgi:hypothetical protein
VSTFSYVDLPLFPDYFYSYSVNLQDDSYNIEICYNEYAKTWYMSIYTEDQELVVAGIALLPSFPLTQDYVIPGLSGFFWLYPIPSITTEKYKEEPEHLDQYYMLRYCYDFQD